MVGIGAELKTKAGPLPVWAWAGLGTATLAGILLVKKKQSMDQAMSATPDSSSSVVGGPSNLIPQAMPMPYTQGGDTFVNTTVNNLPPGGSTKVTNPPPKKKPLPAVDPSKSPARIGKNTAIGKTMIKLGCYDSKGHYAGHQAGGGVPVYGLVGLWFMQGASVHSKGAHCIYIPEKFKAYIL
jgi:hypothetical protein